MKTKSFILAATAALMLMTACDGNSQSTNKQTNTTMETINKVEKPMEQLISMTDALYKRQSTRAFDMNGLTADELRQITDFAQTVEPLIPGAKVKADIVGPDEIKAIMKWRAPHYFAIYSDGSDEGIMNAAYIYEQTVIYMTSLGIGTCWATSVSPKDKDEADGSKWSAVIAFGRPAEGNGWRSPSDVNRKALSDICDQRDERLDAARIAPSSMNNQPWYFRHAGDEIEVYCKKQGLLKKWMVSQNRVDMGIALGNLKIANPTMTFTPVADKTEKDGYTLMGKIRF